MHNENLLLSPELRRWFAWTGPDGRRYIGRNSGPHLAVIPVGPDVTTPDETLLRVAALAWLQSRAILTRELLDTY